jgi:hypothetical protein
MRIFCLLFFISTMLISCSKKELPNIQDVNLLYKDCTNLYAQFPINEVATPNYDPELGMKTIPEMKWPDSIMALNPYSVCRNKYGILILIKCQKPHYWGYYIIIKQDKNPFPGKIVNGLMGKQALFRCNPTSYRGVYEIEQPAGHI